MVVVVMVVWSGVVWHGELGTLALALVGNGGGSVKCDFLLSQHEIFAIGWLFICCLCLCLTWLCFNGNS